MTEIDKKPWITPYYASITRVDLKSHSLYVNGEKIRILVIKDQDKGCLDEQKLFGMGEAIRSFGKPMVHRWAQGYQWEKSLTVLPCDIDGLCRILR